MLKQICIDAGIPFENDKIKIPDWVKHIKLDIGLSYNAPQSQVWLSKESDLMVFGFEPFEESYKSILSPDNKKLEPFHGDILEHRFVNNQFFLIPVALSDKCGMKTFYVTEGDKGCSSLYKPREWFSKIKQEIKVPVFTLSDFLDLLPLDKIPYIDYIKTDTQCADLNIIKGGGNYISDKVVFVTMESDGPTYECDTENDQLRMVQYMESIGFLFIKHANTGDPTFLNKKFYHLAESIFIYQRG
jgi:FkbM family methyltransferase